jgi:hypothetical protein
MATSFEVVQHEIQWTKSDGKMRWLLRMVCSCRWTLLDDSLTPFSTIHTSYTATMPDNSVDVIRLGGRIQRMDQALKTYTAGFIRWYNKSLSMVFGFYEFFRMLFNYQHYRN